jgi:3'-phosphoadenosine 5'-phosphosulfate sulfotransferase (PAPS reductase)/FAD synthetase
MIEQLQTILRCSDTSLIETIASAVNNFTALPNSANRYSINFSGGKDSHVLLGIYLLCKKLDYLVPNIDVVFADTGLEIAQLYQIIEQARCWAEKHEIKFCTVKSTHSYWFIQYALGYPVPTHFARWCTGRLKIQPLTRRKTIPITGRHLGESIVRDTRLKKTCGTNECGTDKLERTIEPIIHFRNCQIWDALFYFDGVVLPTGCFDYLNQMYQTNIQSTKNGTLRMGCFMCPVVSLNTIKKKLSGRFNQR